LYHYADSIYGSGKSVGNTVTYNVASPITTPIYQIMPPVLDTSNYSAITVSVTINRLLITTGNLILSWTGPGQTTGSISLGAPTAASQTIPIPSFNGSRYSLDGLYNFTVTYNDITSLSSIIGVYQNPKTTVNVTTNGNFLVLTEDDYYQLYGSGNNWTVDGSPAGDPISNIKMAFYSDNTFDWIGNTTNDNLTSLQHSDAPDSNDISSINFGVGTWTSSPLTITFTTNIGNLTFHG